jgi:hypothetical protein
MQISIRSAIGQPVNELRITMEAENDVLIGGEERIVVRIGEPMGVLALRLQLHEVNDVDDANLESRQMLTQHGDSRQHFQGRRIAAACQDDIRLAALIVARPLPDADTLGAVHDRGIHGQPLRQGVFAGHHHVDVVSAAQAVIEDRQQAVCIGRQIHANDVGFLVDDVIEKPWVLMRKTIVILLPNMRCEQVVEGGYLAAPGELRGNFEPLGMLAEHRIDDTDEGFVAVEEAMAPGQQVPLEPSLALVFTEHGVEDAPAGSQKFIVLYSSSVPLAIRDFKNGAQEIGQGLVGTEKAEITLDLIELGDVSQELTQDLRILRRDGARGGYRHRVRMKIGHAQVAQQHAAIGVGVRAHSPLPQGGELREVRIELPLFVEQFLGPVTPHPAL